MLKIKEECNIYKKFRRNNSAPFLGIAGYEGIPQNFFMNLMAWLVMVVLFMFLRKKAWNYGRIAIMQKEEIKWTDMFYEDHQGYRQVYDNDHTIAPIVIASAESANVICPQDHDQDVVMSDSYEIPLPFSSLGLITETTDEVEEISNKKSKHKDEVKESADLGGGEVHSLTSGNVVEDSQNPVYSSTGNKSKPNVDSGYKREAIELISRKESINFRDDISENGKGTGTDNDADDGDPGTKRGTKSHDVESHPKIQVAEIIDKGFLSWIYITYSLTDRQYLEKCGEDAVHYLTFQRHLILLAMIITACCLGIILPINFYHSYKNQDFAGFADTTISNVQTRYKLLWAHVSFVNFFIVCSFLIMRRFWITLHVNPKDDCYVCKTIMITGVSKTDCKEDLIRTHFEEAYPDSEVTEVSFAYNLGKLHNAEFKRKTAVSGKLYFRDQWEQAQLKDNDAPVPKMRPYHCSACCHCQCCGTCCKEVDAIDYYSEKERKYTEQVESERRAALTRPLGIVFVTFRSIQSAHKVVENYDCCSVILHPPESRYTKRLRSNHWIVNYAPPPKTIHWENLAMSRIMWYLRFILINIMVAMLVIVFTTPVYVFTTFIGPNLSKPSYRKAKNYTFITRGNETETESITEEKITLLAGLVMDTLPPLIVCILGVALVAVVGQSDIMIGFWTKTAWIYSEMVKTFFFLTFMVIALPSLGVTSISYFMDKIHGLSWSCIFYKENGALFVNYLITSGMVGTGAELMRLDHLFTLIIKLCFAKSRAEIGAIRRSILVEFPIGGYYAWIGLEFAIFACFCVIYPLVTPFGLIYLCLKYWTDRYNLYFAYAPCKVDKRVHRTAISFVMVAMFMLQINLIAYIHFYLGAQQNQGTDFEQATTTEVRTLQACTLIAFSVTAALYIGQACCNLWTHFGHIRHLRKFGLDDTEEEEPEEEQKELDEIELFANGITQPERGLGSNSVLFGRSEEDNKSKKKKPYGRYVAPILRAEFIRLEMLKNRSKSQDITSDTKMEEDVLNSETSLNKIDFQKEKQINKKYYYS